ncbi:hypothetical protein PAMP_011579 [Pampus punctatissimus]
MEQKTETGFSAHQQECGCCPGPHVLTLPVLLLLVPFLPPCVFLGGGGTRWGVRELLPGHINSFPHHPNPPSSSSQPLHRLPAAPPSPQGERVCAENGRFTLAEMGDKQLRKDGGNRRDTKRETPPSPPDAQTRH